LAEVTLWVDRVISGGGLDFRFTPVSDRIAARYFASSGGLMSCGFEQIEQWRGAAGYVDRILRGTKPADLPVQAPIKYELVINMKTGRTLGLTIPQSLLATADEVIE
jgi:putative ABC transport system substrate-binding protein